MSETPLPVLIAEGQTPVPVTMTGATKPSAATVTKGEGTTLAPTTTEAQDAVTEGQRVINRIWERTQSHIAIWVTGATVFIIGTVVIGAIFTGHGVTSEILTLINYLVVMTTLILSFYFSRTNHQAIGGVGPKPNEPYEGR